MEEKKFNKQLLFLERTKKGYTFGSFVKELRKHEPKASKGIVWNWESGESEPCGRYLRAICKVLGKKMDDFYKNN